MCWQVKLFVAWVAVLLASCTPSRSSVAGTYRLSDHHRNGKLELFQDGRLHEVVISAKGERLDIQGKWELDGRRLFREPCVDFRSDGGDVKADACSQEIQMSMKGPILVIDQDFGPVYGR